MANWGLCSIDCDVVGLHGTGKGTVSVSLRPAHTKKVAQLATKHILTKAQGERRDRERSVVQHGLKIKGRQRENRTKG